MNAEMTMIPLTCLPVRMLRSIGPTRLTALVAVVSAAVLLSACATPGPDHTPLASTTPAALGLAPQGDLSLAPQWWRSLGDAQLNALVEQALQGQPSLAVARARVDKLASLGELTHAANGPQAQFSAEVARQRYSENGLVPAPIAGNTWDSGTLQVGASWSPDFFGEHAAELAAVLGQARAAQADAAAAANALATQVSRSYVALARLLAQRAVVERTLAQRQAVLALTQQRFKAGLDTQVERTQAEGTLPDARTQLEILDEQIALARRQVATLCGQAPSAQDTLTPQLAALSLPAQPGVLGADLLGRRPEVVAARWRVEAASQDVAAAKTQFYPNINLSAFAGLNAIGLDKVLDLGSRQLGVTPALRLPLFDGGRLRAQLGGKQADRDLAIAQYNGVVLDAVKEAGDALTSAASLARQQQLLGETQRNADQAYALAVKRYGAGLGNYLVVLGTENQVLAQRRLAVDLQARQLDTRIALMKALGGGWSEDSAASPATVAAAR
jgi:NodT family efflux transporter outer membrane factor (OMF) lipoprotein